MKKILKIAFTIAFIANSSAYSQNSYAKNIVQKLASKKMHGRGYVSKGDKIAAKFIRKEFKKIGLKPFSKDYFQNFSFSINTQPSQMELSIDKNNLIPGVDFLVDPGSPSLKGTFKTLTLTKTDLLNSQKLIAKLKQSSNKVLLVNNYTNTNLNKKEKKQITEIINYLKYSDQHPAKGVIIFTDKKLTWHGSTVQNPKISFTIKKKLDLTKIKEITINSKSNFKKKYTSQNCIGYIDGSSKTDSIIVVSGHYDHLGKMGKQTFFPGANDNASGIALLLSIAKHFSKTENKPKYKMVFIAFGGEEIGLLGSKFFTKNPLFPLNKIKLLLNFDLAGTGEEGIKVVNGSIYKKDFETLQKLNKKHNLLLKVSPRGKACNSDHCFFHELGIKTFYSYTLGGIKAYHDIYDKAETLPLTEFEDYKKLMCLFIKNI